MAVISHYRSRSLFLLTLHFHASVSLLLDDDGQGLQVVDGPWTVGLLKDQDMEKIHTEAWNTHSIFTTSMSIVNVGEVLSATLSYPMLSRL